MKFALRSLLLGGACLIATLANSGANEKPNVLFIFADDQCYETIHALGNDEIETPNLDKLVKRGTSFTRAYNPGAWGGAVCVASRCMLMTGRSLWDAHGIYQNTDKEREAGRFWPSYMKQAGYDTYFTGKWHVRAKSNLAFDHARDERPGMPNQTKLGYNRPLPGQIDPWTPWDQSFDGFWKGGRHWSEIVADHGESYLEMASKSDQPFFMYLAFNAPHDPRQSPKSFVDKYPLNKVKVPENFLPVYPYKDGIGNSKKLRDEALGPFPRTEHAVKVHRQEYYAIITHMDEQIGRMLDALERSGKADNTYIFFSADHGLAVGHHGLIGKQNLYEHSTRVPFIAVGPGIEAGRRVDSPIYLQDVMPTALELASVDKPDHVYFNSLLPMLKKEKDSSSYDAVYGAYMKLQRSVTMDGYKLILYPKLKIMRLYHLAEDPQEMVDLAGNVTMGPTVKKLYAKLKDLQSEMKDTLDLDATYGQALQ